MFNLVDVEWFLRLSCGTFQSLIDLVVHRAAPAEAIALCYKVRVAVKNGVRLWNKWIQYEFCTRNKTCRSYTNTLYKHSKYWIRRTLEQGKFAAFICTKTPEKHPLPDKLVNHSLSWIIPLCGFPPLSVSASTIKSDEPKTSLPLVLPHQDVISSFKAYRADSNDTEWLNCVFWWISLWVIWCQIVFQFSYCSDFSVWK